MNKNGKTDWIRESDEKRILAYILIAALIVLCLPQLLRILEGNGTLMGEQPYYHARMAENALENRISGSDPLIYDGREMWFTPYHFAAAGLSYITGMGIALRMIPIICGMISILLVYLLLKRFEFSFFIRIASIAVLALSPPFIYAFSVMQDSMAIMLTLLGAFLFFHERKRLIFLSFILFVLASLFSVFNALVIAIPLLVYSFIKKKDQKRTLALLFFMAAAVTIAYANKQIPFFYDLQSTSTGLLKEMLSDIGGIFGIGIFYLILFIIGFVYSWNEKKRYYPAYIIMLLLGICFYAAGGYVFVYANFLLCVFAAIGIERIKELRWQMKMIRNLTFIIVCCGLLFSMLSFSARLAKTAPTEKMLTSLDWLKDNSNERDVVLSHQSNGYLIEYASGRPVLLDSYFSSINDFDGKYLDAYSIFHSSDLKDAEGLLRKYNIRYIVITSDMKEGSVWEAGDQGLLYLLRNKDTFKNVYGSDEIEIWKYLQGNK